MPKRNNPFTSKLAHDSVKEHKADIWEKIITALEEMKVGGTSEEIADHLGMPYEVIWKRMKELQDEGRVFNLEGITRPTKKGRKAMVRQLVTFRTPKILVQKELF